MTILKQDYRKTVEQFDGPEIFFVDRPTRASTQDAAVDDEFVVLAKIRAASSRSER